MLHIGMIDFDLDMGQTKRLPINSSIFMGSDRIAIENDPDTINDM